MIRQKQWEGKGMNRLSLNKFSSIVLYFTFEYKLGDPRCIPDHSTLFQFFSKFGRDGKANLCEHILHLFLKRIPFAVQLINFLFQFVVLLQHSSMFLQKNSIFFVLTFDVFFAFALVHCWIYYYFTQYARSSIIYTVIWVYDKYKVKGFRWFILVMILRKMGEFGIVVKNLNPSWIFHKNKPF